MINKKFIAVIMSMTMLVAMTACSKETEETTVAETTTVAEETTTETTEEEVLRFNVDGATEFEEAKLYEVTSEVTVYADWTAKEVIGTYPEGTCISVISTDGVYVMQDNGYIMDASCMELLE